MNKKLSKRKSTFSENLSRAYTVERAFLRMKYCELRRKLFRPSRQVLQTQVGTGEKTLEHHQWRPAKQKEQAQPDDEDESDCKVTFSCSYFRECKTCKYAPPFRLSPPHFLTCTQHFLSKYKVTLILGDKLCELLYTGADEFYFSITCKLHNLEYWF